MLSVIIGGGDGRYTFVIYTSLFTRMVVKRRKRKKYIHTKIYNKQKRKQK